MSQKHSSFSSKFFKFFGGLLLLFVLYISACLIHGTFTDFTPTGVAKIDIKTNGALPLIEDSTFTFLSWNIGYSGLGKESDFFYHGAGFFVAGPHMVRSPKNLVDKNVAGANKTLKENTADFMLLQEVDYGSKRSYYVNHEELFLKSLPAYSATTAINFDVNRVPTPIFQPWKIYGEANSGLLTLSRFIPTVAERHQLPGKFSWPNRLFLLDRCLGVHHYPMAGGKKLMVINLHNSAFDATGKINGLQMAYLKELITEEYENGNYVVVGGDWNQCPPGFSFDKFMPGAKKYSKEPNIKADFMPADWQWAFDPSVPTIRSTNEVYQQGKSFVSLIDFFLLSPNLELIEVKGLDQGFDYSDHQAVWMEVKIKR